MRERKKTGIRAFGCLLLLLPLFTVKTSGCTFIVAPVTKFDPAEFIFVGEVVGFSGPLSNRYVTGEVWGLVIRPEREIYLPSRSTEYVEVYPYRVADDCRNVGWLNSELARHYPLGSRVRVIAVEAKNLEGGAANSNLRLAVPIGSDGGVSEIRRGNSLPSAESAYDYRAYRKTDASQVDLTLEVRKDLLRLWKAKEDEKVAILERLLYHPHRIDYERIVKGHMAGEALVQSLITRRREWEGSRAGVVEK